VPERLQSQRGIAAGAFAYRGDRRQFRYRAPHNRFTTDSDTPDDYARALERLGIQDATTAGRH
jgi:hypothetical protein